MNRAGFSHFRHFAMVFNGFHGCAEVFPIEGVEVNSLFYQWFSRFSINLMEGVEVSRKVSRWEGRCRAETQGFTRVYAGLHGRCRG